MSEEKLRERSETDKRYKWNIEAMYPDEADWEKDFDSCIEMSEAYSRFAGRLAENAGTLLEALDERSALWQKAERVLVYAHMKKDEDNRVAKYQSMDDRCNGLVAKVAANTAFFTPELLEAPEDRILGFIDEDPRLKTYEFLLKDTLRLKAHILTKPEELLLANLSELTSATNDIFTMLNNADMRFGMITDEKGVTKELTQGNYTSFLESKDRDVRKAAFTQKYKAYIDLINTIATTYNYNTKTDAVYARLRKYPSALEASLAGDNIPKSVYTNLISAVNEALPANHKYMETRKRLLGVSELHMYDIYVPLIDIKEPEITFEEAVDTMKNALSVLGSDYVDDLMNGVNNQGWIDVYENRGKTSGAYSFGSYDSYPYVLMNFSGKLNDIFTLVHECGHSMHSFYTRREQPYVYGGHSIFTAEVASTVNESLLMKYLLKQNKDNPDMTKYLINKYLEEFRTTLVRQTMFAEFELLSHEAVEAGEVLTAESMCDMYSKLNAKYFGPAAVNDDEISYEWARIPHFYNAFYVYKYATGYSAATAISNLIIDGAESGDNTARDNYRKFLTTGESDYPIELLKIAGVDMGTEGPVKSAMKIYSDLVDEFDRCTKQK